MSKGNYDRSALFIGNGDDDAAVLAVGGWSGNGNEADLLTNRPHQRGGEQGSRGGAWRWRQLSPMREGRINRPGMLLLGRERVLVVGGSGNSKTADVLQLQFDDNDRGVWTLLTQPLTLDFSRTFLLSFNNRILAVGELLINLVKITSKKCLSNIYRLHFRPE